MVHAILAEWNVMTKIQEDLGTRFAHATEPEPKLPAAEGAPWVLKMFRQKAPMPGVPGALVLVTTRARVAVIELPSVR
jgi:hypothetical protein